VTAVPALPRHSTERPICVAILAIGGQGGGVLTDWVVALAEAQGWHAQSTSVPGVAQRTGATIYYVEMLPAKNGHAPVLSLMPMQGDVDVVLAAEWMEAGRSMLRGLVTPERTTLIASTHRSFAVIEKEKPGDAIAQDAPVLDAAGVAAKRVIAFDMETLATRSGSVISACLFGALSASGALPFGRDAFETVIKAGGRAIEPSLKAFAAAYEGALTATAPPAVPAKRFMALPATAKHPVLNPLLERIRAFPTPLHAMLFAGVRRLVDFQDPAYAHDYLQRMTTIYALDCQYGGAAKHYALTAAAAKYVAAAMSYDDVIRVAELKTRAGRFERVRREAAVAADEIVYMTEFMHPRLEELAGTLPAALGRLIEAHPGPLRVLLRKGRRVRTGTISWFLVLYLISALKPFRRRTLRHAREIAHLDRWLSLAATHACDNYDLSVEILGARRLIKGYSDTLARGLSKFDRVIGAVPLLAPRADGAAWLRRLRQAALMDETGVALDGALKTVASL